MQVAANYGFQERLLICSTKEKMTRKTSFLSFETQNSGLLEYSMLNKRKYINDGGAMI